MIEVDWEKVLEEAQEKKKVKPVISTEARILTEEEAKKEGLFD